MLENKEISTQTCLHIHVVRGCRTSSAVSFYNRWSWSVPWRQFGWLQSQRGLRIDILSSICILHRVVQCRGCLTDGALCRIIASRKNNKYCLHVCTLSLWGVLPVAALLCRHRPGGRGRVVAPRSRQTQLAGLRHIIEAGTPRHSIFHVVVRSMSM